jgi:hypothetical protein
VEPKNDYLRTQDELTDPQEVGRSDGPRPSCSVSGYLDLDTLIRRRSADSMRFRGHYAAPVDRTHNGKRPLLLLTSQTAWRPRAVQK